MANQPELLKDTELDSVSGGRYTGPVFAYVLQQGDNMQMLATRYGTTVKILQELNSLSRDTVITAGMIILIPQR